MDRQFTVTLPADTNYHNLYTALTAITGAIPTDGILPDRVNYLKIQGPTALGAATVTVADSNFSNIVGGLIGAGDIFERSTGGLNTICLRDFYIAGSANSLSFNVSIGSR